MSDITGIEVSDVLGLAKPLAKLIEVVSAGIGKVYEPCNIRRLAHAEAEKMTILGDVMTQNPQVAINYSDEKSMIIDAATQQLLQRTQSRLAFQELKKQQNIETVIESAYRQIEQEQEVSATPVDPDWISNFFDNVSRISNEQMQFLWSRILAGEVKQPNSFSLRTLNVLKTLTSEDAKCFENIAPFVINDKFIPAKFLSENNISDSEAILSLIDAGLMQSEEGKLSSPECKDFAIKLFSKNSFAILHSDNSSSFFLADRIYYLTKAGMELLQLLACPDLVSWDYLVYVAGKFHCQPNNVRMGDFRKNNISDFELNLRHEIGIFLH